MCSSYGRSLKRVSVECICIIPIQGYVDLDLSCTIEFDGADRGCFELPMSVNLSRLQWRLVLFTFEHVTQSRYQAYTVEELQSISIKQA